MARPAVRSFAAPERRAALAPVRGAPSGARPIPAGAAPRGGPAGESDRFTVAPVFGSDSKALAAVEGGTPPGKPAAPALPPVDPIDEIESLIGEAVRVGLNAPRAEAKVAPVVPPLNTTFAPRRAAIKEAGPETEAAEAAILAAAAASGAELGRNGGSAAVDPNPYRRRQSARPERRASRVGQYVGAAVAVVLLLAAGFGVYWVFGMGQPDAQAPVLTADASPDKAAPPAGSSAPTATEADGSVVFNKMDGVQDTAAEAIVSRDDSADTSVADVATTVGDGADDSALTEGGLANRKVRTVTVRPDGTIVSGDDAVAGSEALPVDRPNVPDLPGADVQRSDLLAAIPDGTAAGPIAAATAEGGPTAMDSVDTTTDATSVAALIEPDATASIDTSIVAPVPMARPDDRSALGGGGTADQASLQAPAAVPASPINLLPAAAAPAAAAPATPVATSGTAAAYVQLSSQKSQADAQASLNQIKSRWNALFRGETLQIQRADLGSKGIYYRVRLPASTLQDATEICASIKANGGECFPTNG
jgi:hypothetical protein